MPLWLVNSQGVTSDSAIIGWTLGVYNAAAAFGRGYLGCFGYDKVSRRWLVVSSILLALPLTRRHTLCPDGFSAFLRHRGAGRADGERGHPASHRERSRPCAARRRHGLRDADGSHLGDGGRALFGMGAMQSALGLTPAILIGYLFLIPAAVLAYVVLEKHRTTI